MSDTEPPDEIAPTTLPPAGRTADLRFALHLLRQNPLIVVGTIISAGTIFISIFADYLVNPKIANMVPNYALGLCWNNPLINWGFSGIKDCGGPVFPLGTDFFGRSVLSVIILAIPLDVRIALEVVASAVLIGVVFGSAAAYAGGVVDEVILRVTDVFLAVPAILLAIVLLAITPAYEHTNFNLLTEAILITWWPTYVRLIRSQVLSEKERPYVESLRSMGAGRLRILFRHVVPNSIYPVFVQATLDIGSVILTVSALTFLGFSPRPEIPELGNLANQGIQYLHTAPWLIIFSGLTILIISLGFNLLGDGIRDVLDPRLRR